MILLTKAVVVLLSSFVLAVLIGFILIPILKKIKANQNISEYLRDKHIKKTGTPTMGGLIFIGATLIITLVMLFLKKIEINYSLIIVLFTFLTFAIIGFIDDFLIVIKKNNKGLSESKKLVLQLLVAIIFFYLFMKSGNEPLLWIRSLNFKLNIGWLYGLFILFVLVASSNAVNITDGLDGLSAGLSLIAFLTFGIITYNTGWLEGYESIALFCFAIVGSLLGFLVFNVNPAKIFMGDTGSLSLGAALGSIAIVTRHEILLILVGIVFVIETLTCVIQRIYYKIRKKRLFIMTPIHHTFEKKGWDEVSIVKLFWIVGLVASLLAISVVTLL